MQRPINHTVTPRRGGGQLPDIQVVVRRVFRFCSCRWGVPPGLLNSQNRQVVVYVLLFFCGWNVQKIADTLKKSKNTIYSDISVLDTTVIKDKRAYKAAKELVAAINFKK